MKDKILIDVTVPLVPPKISTVQMPPAGSAALEAHEILGENSQVTCAFQNIPYENLLLDGPVGCDVLVSGTSKEARSETLILVSAAGLTGWDAGPIENSIVVEGMTSILIGINKRYGSKTAGIRVVGVQALAEHP
jgi:8-hydroxy-5-deazaflavin:NADPH oxidoreductase